MLSSVQCTPNIHEMKAEGWQSIPIQLNKPSLSRLFYLLSLACLTGMNGDPVCIQIQSFSVFKQENFYSYTPSYSSLFYSYSSGLDLGEE